MRGGVLNASEMIEWFELIARRLLALWVAYRTDSAHRPCVPATSLGHVFSGILHASLLSVDSPSYLPLEISERVFDGESVCKGVMLGRWRSALA